MGTDHRFRNYKLAEGRAQLHVDVVECRVLPFHVAEFGGPGDVALLGFFKVNSPQTKKP